MKKNNPSHVVIPDTQVKPGVDTSHLAKITKYIIAHKPEVIVQIGDHWDFPSLSSYSSRKELENKRVLDDIAAGNDAMEAFMKPIRRAINKDPKWNPRLILTLGNHEQRLVRLEKERPELSDVLGYHQLHLKDWEVYDFLKPVEIHGVWYCHYFTNPMSGRPYGGQISNVLNKLKFSFVQGHKQELAYAMMPLNNGKTIHGVIAGACYLHDEDYKGHQGNNHWRGILHLRNVCDGDFDIQAISLSALAKGVY